MSRSWLRIPSVSLFLTLTVLGCGKKDDDDQEAAISGTRPLVYVGSEQNITWYSIDGAKGKLTMKGTLELPHTAAFMARNPNGKFLYALLRTRNEMDQQMVQMKPLEGFVVTYAVDQNTGAIEEVGRVSSQGDRPTYITVDRTGRWALVANNLGHLVGHSISVFEIKADGKLAAAKQFHMTGVRAHQIRIHPSNKYVYVPNIDSDTISQFLFDASTGKMTLNKTPTVSVDAMSGPRHLDFHPNGKWVYLSNEYAATVMSFKVNDDGTLTRFHTASGLPSDFTGKKWQSEIRVTPNGRFVYAGERTHESIATFAIDQQDGTLTFKGNEPTMGKTPRNFVLSPDGKWMVVGNQESNSLVTFGVDPDKGSLSMVHGPLEQSTPYVHMFLTLP